MNLNYIKAQAGKFVTENSSTLLTAVGVAGTITTAVLSARAGLKADELIEKEIQRRIGTSFEDNPEPNMTKLDKVKLVWPQFVPPAATGTVTITAIIMANRMTANKVAALAAAYSLSENRLKEYQAKVAEKLTGPKNQAIHDEIAQDRVNANPPSREVLILGGKDVLCFDSFTGRYFNSTMEDIKKAEISTNAEIFNHNYASLSYFYDEVGLPPTTFSDEVGWNQISTGPMELRFSTVMSPDEKPCLAIDFVNPPQPNYHQLY